MYQGTTVFSQIMDSIPMHQFRKCAERYNGNKGIRSFSCLDQFLCMAFAQLTYRKVFVILLTFCPGVNSA